jgi:4a-hydroxytetrahydrobiopterin dehydratase
MGGPHGRRTHGRSNVAAARPSDGGSTRYRSRRRLQRREDPITSLAESKCVACRRDAPTVSDSELAELRPQVPDWELAEVDGVKRLRRAFLFDDFAQALAFTNRVAELAEMEGHHPALLTEWGRTTVSWWTHKIKGLHRNDFVMAAKTDRAYAHAREGALSSARSR